MKRTYVVKNIITVGRNIHIVDNEAVIDDIGYCEKYSYNVDKTWLTVEDEFFNNLGTVTRRNKKFSLVKFGIFYNKILMRRVFCLEFCLNDWYIKRISTCSNLVLKLVNPQTKVDQLYTFKMDTFEVNSKTGVYSLSSFNEELIKFMMNFFADTRCRETPYELIFNFIP